MKTIKKEIFTFNNVRELSRDNISKKSNGGINIGLELTFYKFFGGYLIFLLLSRWKSKIEGKLSTSQFIIVHHNKIVDIFFEYNMGWIKPKNHLCNKLICARDGSFLT
jgi:hypothetical protein